MKTSHLLSVSAPLFLLSGFLFATPPQGGLDDGAPTFGEPGGPTRPLLGDERTRWVRGRDLFDLDFHRTRGVGTPEFNADSCRACHQDPVLGGSGALDLNVFRAGYIDEKGVFDNITGGQAFSKLRPAWVDGREDHDPDEANVFEQRQTPAVFGLGLIDGILDDAILANEDPDDLDGDGVRGVARRITVGTGGVEIGRFGWKSQIPHLADFLRDAMGGECGITTPDDGRGFALVNDGDMAMDPELSQAEFDDMVFFLANLGPLIRRGPEVPGVQKGEELFNELGCATCHVPSLSGVAGPVPLYSDLLLHDVMPDDFRGMSEEGAGIGMYRTPPLWGIAESAPYMHDGRAENLRQSIEHHFGEANTSRIKFGQQSERNQTALILFLESI